MRQFSPFQEVTKIPVLFSAQACSVPAQTTSRAGSARLSWSRQQRGSGAQCKHCPSPRNPCMEKGALPRYCFYFILFFFLCGAWSSGKSSTKYIHSHGTLEQDLDTDKLVTGSGIRVAGKHLEDLGWEGALPALGEGDLVGMPVQDRQPLAPAAFLPQVLPRSWCGTPCTGRETTKTRGHRTCGERQSSACSFWRREGRGKAGITSLSRKYLPAKGRSQHEMQKRQECDAPVV